MNLLLKAKWYAFLHKEKKKTKNGWTKLSPLPPLFFFPTGEQKRQSTNQTKKFCQTYLNAETEISSSKELRISIAQGVGEPG